MKQELHQHFDTHLQKKASTGSLHPSFDKLFLKFPANINKLKNIIFYGPPGVGKYTLMLSCIKRYSASELKYEKKLTVTYNKEPYMIKMSDIHFEVDMSILGCNAKLLWNEIYNQIVDVTSSYQKYGIIICYNFHNINSELLEIFYSYMQGECASKIKFIIITEQIGFLPSNIINNCQILNIARPSNLEYNNCFNVNLDKSTTNGITNIKSLYNLPITEEYMKPHIKLCKRIITYLTKPSEMKFSTFRDVLYEILIYGFDISECVWYILEELISTKKIMKEKLADVLLNTYTFFLYYNNNYRPIYHLEDYMYSLIISINDYGGGSCNECIGI